MTHLIFHRWKLINWTEHCEERIVHYDPGIGIQYFYWRLEGYACKKCDKRKEVTRYHTEEELGKQEYIARWGKQEIINHTRTC